MNKSLKWQLAIKFAAITSIIYLVMLGCGLLIFKGELTSSLDNQLDTLLSELADVVDLENNKLTLEKPKKVIKKQPLGRLACIQLFDQKGLLVEEHGTHHSGRFSMDTEEYLDKELPVRSKSLALESDNNEIVGYLQVKLPTTARDRAVSNYCLTMAIITALGLVALSLSAFIFSKMASKPLELSYELLRQFTADAAHELGTPIATIVAAVDNLRAEIKSSHHIKRLNVIENAAARMNKLADDLMLLTNLGTASNSSNELPTQINMTNLISQLAEEFEDRYNQKDLKLENNSSGQFELRGYRDTVVRLLSNLLENSLRYTNNGGIVSINGYKEGAKVCLVVADTGIGIPSDCMNKIFNRFYRADKARSRDAGGNGLGLSIVKAITELHDGDISIESEEGKGTKITVVLKDVGK